MQAFENIGLAKVAKSAEQARDLGYLRPTDQISMNRDRLLADAKARVLKLAEDYSPPEPHTYQLPGPSGRLALEMALNDLASSGKATQQHRVELPFSRHQERQLHTMLLSSVNLRKC